MHRNVLQFAVRVAAAEQPALGGRVMFPLSIRGSRKAHVESGIATEDILAAIRSQLEKDKARRVTISGQTVSFSAGLFRFVTSMNRLVAISSGKISVSRDHGETQVSYDLRCTELVVIATAGVAFFLGPPVLAAPNLTTGEALAILAAAWLWLVGGNYVFASVRFPSLIRDAAGEVAAGERCHQPPN